MKYSEALTYLYSLGNEVLTAKLGLHNIDTLLTFLGEPHKKFESILIAGTNGKGSVAAFCDSILRASGHKTGLYTSPHLLQIEERIRTDGSMISAHEFGRLAGEVKDAVNLLMGPARSRSRLRLDRHPTYFEMVTAIAFKYFAERQIEIAVLEIGLGGRLDATNVVDPLGVVITNVELDHQQYLGNSIREIATEKAGVIKPRSCQMTKANLRQPLPVVFSGDEGQALRVIEQRCRAMGAKLSQPVEDTHYEAIPDRLGRFKLRLKSGLGAGIEIALPLAGAHQVLNALTAIRVLELSDGVRREAVARNLVGGITQTSWPGRLEILDFRPKVILDGAHNPAAAQKVRDYLEAFLTSTPPIMVFGAMRDKSVREMATLLFPLASQVVLAPPDHARSATPYEILKLVPEYATSVRISGSVREALAIAEELANEDDTILVVGSLFLVGEAKELLSQRPSQTLLSSGLGRCERVRHWSENR